MPIPNEWKVKKQWPPLIDTSKSISQQFPRGKKAFIFWDGHDVETGCLVFANDEDTANSKFQDSIRESFMEDNMRRVEEKVRNFMEHIHIDQVFHIIY